MWSNIKIETCNTNIPNFEFKGNVYKLKDLFNLDHCNVEYYFYIIHDDDLNKIKKLIELDKEVLKLFSINNCNILRLNRECMESSSFV
jgi:hypothetical protein